MAQDSKKLFLSVEEVNIFIQKNRGFLSQHYQNEVGNFLKEIAELLNFIKLPEISKFHEGDYRELSENKAKAIVRRMLHDKHMSNK